MADIHELTDIANEGISGDKFILDREITPGDWVAHQIDMDDLFYKKAVINISNAEILTCANTRVQLLPNVGASEYLDIKDIFLEYTRVAPSFTTTADFCLIEYFNGATSKNFALITNFLNDASSKIFKINETPTNFGTSDLTFIENNTPLAHGLYFKLDSGTDPTLGGGTIRVVVYYKVRTLGA